MPDSPDTVIKSDIGLFSMGIDDVDPAPPETEDPPAPDEPGPDDEGEEGDEKEQGEEDAAEAPPWAQDLASTLHVMQSEIAQRPREQEPQREAPRPAPPAEDDLSLDEPITLRQLQQHLGQLGGNVQQHLGFLYQSSLRQERQRFDDQVAALRRDRPEFDKHVPAGNVERVWQEYAKNPAQFGGFGQPWAQEFERAYAPSRLKTLEQENATLKKQLDAKGDKQAQKREEQKQKIGKVMSSGQGFQEPATDDVKTGVVRPFRELRSTVLRAMKRR